MKYLFLFILSINTAVKAQNLVPNSGFELYFNPNPPTPFGITYDTIINTFGGINDWYTSTVIQTYALNYCVNLVPLNEFGYQYPHKDSGYALITLHGGFVDDSISNNYYLNHEIERSHLQVQLTKNLTKNHYYQTECFVSLAVRRDTNNLQKYTFATDEIGFNISNKRITKYDGTAALDLSYTIRNPKGNFLSDTTGWTKICGVYKANGDEKFLTIGNFLHGVPPALQLVDSANNPVFDRYESRYFIDDVSVEDMHIHDSTNDTIVCPNSMFTKKLNAFANASKYVWSTGDTTASIFVSQIGRYWVQMDVECGIVTDTIIVSESSEIPFSINDVMVCELKDTIIVCPTTANKYLWSNGDTNATSLINSFGKYWLQTTNICNQTYTDTFTFYPKSLNIPDNILGADTQICFNDNNINYDIPINVLPLSNTYLWNDNSTNHYINIDKPNKYWVTITNECFANSDTITVTNCPINKPVIYVPNGFTPNGDNVNDDLIVKTQNISSFSIRIFNRWGEQLFEAEDGLRNWQGYQNGLPCTIGTYYYLINYKTLDNQLEVKAGEFELIK